MADPGQDATDKAVVKLAKRLHAEYNRAYKEMSRRLKEGMAEFRKDDAAWQQRVADGQATQKAYEAWKWEQATSQEWMRHMVDELSAELTSAEAQARRIINGEAPNVFAENYNYGTYQVEAVGGIDTAFTLVDGDTVARLVRDRPDLLPRLSEHPDKAERWAKRKMTLAVTQSVLQGDSVDRAAGRIRAVTNMDERASLRAARTALTGAENAGRIEGYNRAAGMGIDIKAQWMATLDNRTRDSHRALDGEVRGTDGRFSNGLRYPGDPDGDPGEVWNCRCTLVARIGSADEVTKGERPSELVTDAKSYETWKQGRKAVNAAKRKAARQDTAKK